MAEWLDRVGDATREHREKRALAYDRRATGRRNRARLDGANEIEADARAQWHARRAKGQRERIERVECCANELLVVVCQACGLLHERPARCGCRLLCVRCRGVRARQTRMRFLAARASLLAEAQWKGLLNPTRRGGRWGERLLTLTVPHRIDDSVESRIERLLEAWRQFVRILQAYKRERTLPTLTWFRVFEWTPGADALGHPHLHVWLFSPYLDREMLCDWWTRSVQSTNLAVGCVSPVVDIRAAEKGVEQELVKYLTKDIDEHGNKLAPALYAKVYCALDQRRALQASRGFMARADEQPRRCTCGSSLPRLVHRRAQHEHTGQEKET